MLLSKSCEYALRTALYLASEPSVGNASYTAVREISDELKIPYHFLAKTVQTLIQAGIFSSMRGQHGGIALARPASQIRLKEIVFAVDGPHVFTECVLGLPGCGDQKPCPLHAQWASARSQVDAMFSAATLAETAARIQAGDFRLSNLIPA